MFGYIEMIQIYFQTMGWMVGNKEHNRSQEEGLCLMTNL